MPYKDRADKLANHVEYMRTRYATDPEFRRKQKSRAKVQKALKFGRLVKNPCACGNPDSEAHHDDYDQPLKVTWLCRDCHAERHGGPGCRGVLTLSRR